MTGRGLRIRDAHRLLWISFGLFMLISFAASVKPFSDWYLLDTAMGELALVIPAAIFLRRRDRDWKEVISDKPMDGRNLAFSLGVLLCAYPLLAIINMLSMLFVKNQVASAMPKLTSYGIVGMLLTVAILPAFCEEFLCRGILFMSYSNISPLAGALLSALMFGLLHRNLNQFFYTVFLGLLFALMDRATGTIQSSVTMHMLLNGVDATIMYVAARRYPDTLESASQVDIRQMLFYDQDNMATSIIAIVLVSAFFAACIAILIRQAFKYNHTSLKPDLPAQEREKYGKIVDLPLILFIAVTAVLTFLGTDFL